MTTQAVTASLSGPGANGGRAFAGTATDGAYTALNTVTGTAELGFGMKGKIVDTVNFNATAGGYAWAIRNRVSQTIDRFGFGTLSASSAAKGSKIPPITILQDHILQSYTLAAGTTYLAWVVFRGRPPELFDATVANAAQGEMLTVSDNSTIGSFADQVIEAIYVQGPDGKIVQLTQLYDANGGELLAWYGGERGATSSGVDASTNVCIEGLSIPVKRGMALKWTVQA